MVKSNEQIISQLISILRFPLMAGVVIIHGGIVSSFVKAGVAKGEEICLPITSFVENLLSHGILGMCVPLFYFFSGYLFFLKGEWGWKTYCWKLKKRIRSLLFPYLLYTCLAILVFGILQVLMPQMQSGTHVPIKDWCTGDFIYNGFWRYGEELIPFVGPFWFLRNLMIIVVISPILYSYIKCFRHIGIILLGILYCLDIWSLSVIAFLDLFFFAWGAYYSIFKKDFIAIQKSYLLYAWFSLPLFFIDAVTKTAEWNIYVHKISILLGVILIINLFSSLLIKRDLKANKLLISSTFFVYAIHEPYLDQITKVLAMIVHLPKIQILADCIALIIYIVYNILVIMMLVSLYWSIRRFSPKLASILSGGRNY